MILLPVLKAHRTQDGQLVVTQKYLDGAAEYAKNWPGPVTSLFEVSAWSLTDMDQVDVSDMVLNHNIEFRPSDPRKLADRLKTAALVVGFLSPFERATTELCNKIGVPVVHVSEYTLRTEWQIIDSGATNSIIKLRQKLWAWRAARTKRYLIRLSAGLQCNGTPTYDAYRALCPGALLYFDNRVRKSDLINSCLLQKRVERVLSSGKLRLVFGGRFLPMKGVMHLPKVALELRKLGIPFELSIHGAGKQEAPLRRAIEENGLSAHVSIFPPTDFLTGWVPVLKEKYDLFICCHLQGDPSSTYSETMSCGLPIAGYDNEAFAGIATLSEAGFLAPLGDYKALAQVIAGLHADRNRIVEAAQRARAFSEQHCFETTFERRTSHFLRLSRIP
ncbi:glycosyltransferase [Ruegeria sp. ANG-S4]|uniref:glycosyltransferase n=1 Tax=Ruegeria sp. ANG-S4 TaxID=1577904 RepID=UPI00187C00AD|nr:glycosyltransferase [Ruegeria sp. ANG-S4]